MKTKQKLKKLLLLLILPMLVLTTSCSKDDGPSLNDLTGILSFGFADPVIKDFPFEVDNINYVIKNTDSLPYQFDVSSLTAQYNAISGSTVMVGAVAQTSGVTKNDFTNAVTYAVTSEDGSSTKNYRVELHVAKLNPEGVQWHQKSPNAFGASFETQEYFYLNGKHWVITGKKFKWFSSTPETKIYSSEDGSSWAEVTPTGDVPVGYSHNVVVRGNKAYVVGLVSGVDTYGAAQPALESTLYVTEDGLSWAKTESALDKARILSPVFKMDNKIYAFGGNLQGGFGSFEGSKQTGAPFWPAASISNTTLISTDGVTFNPSEEYTPEMPKRTYSAGYVYKGKMYVTGGIDARGYPLSDVWSSTDGVNWTEVSNEAYVARVKASTVVYDDKVWMFGGQLADATCATETLVSNDGGVTWNAVAADQALPANYKARCNADITVDAAGNLWIVGGQAVTSVTYTEEGYVKDVVYETLTDVWSGKLNSFD